MKQVISETDASRLSPSEISWAFSALLGGKDVHEVMYKTLVAIQEAKKEAIASGNSGVSVTKGPIECPKCGKQLTIEYPTIKTVAKASEKGGKLAPGEYFEASGFCTSCDTLLVILASAISARTVGKW